MADDGGDHDAADNQRPGGVPIDPKHASLRSISTARGDQGNGKARLPFPARSRHGVARAKRGAISCWSAVTCDRFDRCGALPRRLHPARLRAGAAGVWAGRPGRHACRPCRACLRGRCHGTCGVNAPARQSFVSHALFSAVNEFIGSSLFALHDRSSFHRRIWLDAGPTRCLDHPDLSPGRVAVWTVLGPPDHPTGPRPPSRDLTAAVR